MNKSGFQQQQQHCTALLFPASTLTIQGQDCNRLINTMSNISMAEIVQILMSLASSHVNCTSPASDLRIDRSKLRQHISRDCALVQFILANGIPKEIIWEQVKRNFIYYVQQLLHQKVHVLFINIDDEKDFLERNDNDTKEDFFILHGRYFVYLVIPSAFVCMLIYEKAMENMTLHLTVSQEIREKIIDLYPSVDKPAYWPKYSVSFGLSFRRQRSSAYAKSRDTHSRNAIIHSTRGGKYVWNSHIEKKLYDINHTVHTIYKNDFLPVFNGKRKFGASGKCFPRLRLKEMFTTKERIYIPSPSNMSLPAQKDQGAVSLATLENEVRSLSEWLLVNVFGTLPYAMVPVIMADNLKEANDLLEKKRGSKLPCSVCNRIYVKGTICNLHAKCLHDDENGALSPSIWTNIIGDDSSVLSFRGRKFNVSLLCGQQRFCWFMGYIPHESTIDNSEKKYVVLPDGRMSPVRLSHSSYTKPEYEYLCLVLLNAKYRRKTISSLHIRH